VALVVRRFEARERDGIAARWSMNEHALAHIDTDVRELGLVLKEDEVTLDGVLERDFLRRFE
jgi:hypothetical protein